jgi:uncharacterized protein
VAGTEINIPVTVINGLESGKNILITAGIHGCEFSGIETVSQLSKEIEPESVCGAIILVHCANVSGFYQKCAAVVPEDGKNLNRVFPGDTDGTISKKIAHTITQQLQSKADFYLDLHGGDLYEQATPYVYYPGVAKEEVSKISCEAAKRLSVPYRVKSTATSGAYNSAAVLGIPSLLIERGGRGAWNNEEVNDYKKDIYRVLNYLRVLKSQEESINIIQKEIVKAVYVDSKYNGYWYPEVKAGDAIEPGQLLGIIRDAFGGELGKYYSEVKGVVLYMTVSLAICEGESLIAYGKVEE